MSKKIRVLIVDDSALIRQMFTEMLGSSPEIEVIGTAFDPYDAREKIKQMNPDVITLDVEMPKMDGISFLEKIMHLRPMPVVMVSTLTQKGADITIQALELGAVDYVSKPTTSLTRDTIGPLKDELISKVIGAAGAKVGSNTVNEQAVSKVADFTGIVGKTLIAIGSSTGGVEAIRDVLTRLPGNMPPIVITQHMPELFTKSFAARLDKLCATTVVEAVQGQKLQQGHAYIAPGSHHMEIVRQHNGYIAQLNDGPLVSGHRPSVDVMFASVAEATGAHTVSAILTGMGKDGAAGMLRIRQSGGYTIGEHEQTCVVYGMPKAAYQLGAVEKVLPLHNIPAEIIRACNTRK